MDEKSEGNARRGSARWRQQQRKERLLEQNQVSPRKAVERQVMPSDGVKIPKINLPKRTKGMLGGTAYTVLTVVLAIGMIYLLRLFNPPDAVSLPNAIWLGSGWSYDLPQEEETRALVERLQRNRIGTAYVWVSYIKDDLTWSGKTADRDAITGEVRNTVNPATGENYRNELAEMEPNIIAFVEQYKTLYPEGKLYAWISFPVTLGGTNRLENETLHTRVAELATVLIATYGFDGIYLNIEPVFNDDADFLQLLRTMRLTMDDLATSLNKAEGIPIAVAVPPDWRPSDASVPYGQGFTQIFEWSREYKQSVALLVDEVLIMAYNSGLERPDDYSVWVAYQTQAYATAIAELGIETRVLVGVPTYPIEVNGNANLPPAHNPAVENITTAVQGVNSGLLQAGDAASIVGGLTIYAEWTTEDDEWAMFQTNWVDATK